MAAATGELARAEILRPDPPLGFVHPLVRDAVYRELPPGERALLHERAAVLLRDAGAPSEQVAAQLLEAPRRGAAWVVDALEAAGATAMRRGAADSAVALLRRALEEPPAPERRAAGARRPRHRGGADERPGRRRPPPGGLRAARGAGRARAGSRTGSRACSSSPAASPEAAALAREARAALPPGDDELEEMLEALELATNYLGGLTPDDARARRARTARRRARAAARHGRRRLGLPRRRRRTRCCALALEALERGDADRARERRVLRSRRSSRSALADRDEAIAWWDASLEAAHRDGSLFAVASVHLFYGMTLLWRGDLAGAAEMLAQGQDEFTIVGLRRDRARSTSTPTSCRVALERGDLAAARARARAAARAIHGSSDDVRYRLGAEHELLIAEGRLDGGARASRDELERALRRVREPGRRPLALAPRARARPARPARRGARARRLRARARAALGRAGRDRPRAARPRHAARRPRRPRGGGPRARRLRRPARPGQGALRARAARCGATGGRPRRASRCAARWSSPRPATRRGWPSRCAPSSTRPARGRAPTPWPGWRR